MKQLFLPKNVSVFINSPFDQSPVEEFDVDEDNQYFCSINGIIYSKDMKILYAFPQYKNITSYIVPNTVETIAEAALTRFVYLERIVIADSVTDILPGFLYRANDKIKEVIIFRGYYQKKPNIVSTAFEYSNFKMENITYIYSSQIPKSCKFQFRFSMMSSYLYVFISL